MNDATALVAYRVALIAVATGSFSPADAGLTFVAVGVGGIAFGLLLGIVISWVLKRVDDPVFSVVLTFLAPIATYLPAEDVPALRRARDGRGRASGWGGMRRAR